MCGVYFMKLFRQPHPVRLNFKQNLTYIHVPYTYYLYVHMRFRIKFTVFCQLGPVRPNSKR